MKWVEYCITRFTSLKTDHCYIECSALSYTWSDLLNLSHNFRSGSSESVGWRVHQWSTSSEPYSSPNCGNGWPRYQAVYDFTSSPSISWMCFENSKSISRNRQHSAWSDWWQQTKSFDTRRWATNRRLPKRESHHIYLGNTRSIGKSKLFFLVINIENNKITVRFRTMGGKSVKWE